MSPATIGTFIVAVVALFLHYVLCHRAPGFITSTIDSGSFSGRDVFKSQRGYYDRRDRRRSSRARDSSRDSSRFESEASDSRFRRSARQIEAGYRPRGGGGGGDKSLARNSCASGLAGPRPRGPISRSTVKSTVSRA